MCSRALKKMLKDSEPKKHGSNDHVNDYKVIGTINQIIWEEETGFVCSNYIFCLQQG